MDPTLWKQKPEEDVELSNRLGWLNLPSLMQDYENELKDFAEEVKKAFDNIVLLGMGGSSLAPEVFFKTFGKKKGYPALTVLDSTHPLSVRRILDNYNLTKTLFIVSSKSGSTTETMSLFYAFYDAISKSGMIGGIISLQLQIRVLVWSYLPWKKNSEKYLLLQGKLVEDIQR